MLRLRFAMAAFAAEGRRPATVPSRLNALMFWSGGGVTASAAAARYSPHDGVLTWVNAGTPAAAPGEPAWSAAAA